MAPSSPPSCVYAGDGCGDLGLVLGVGTPAFARARQSSRTVYLTRGRSMALAACLFVGSGGGSLGCTDLSSVSSGLRWAPSEGAW